ncbi:MAG: prepilin-type N-terminal cleavage/methylation domain-containing protein [Candidatus Sumerlaeota bacterium]
MVEQKNGLVGLALRWQMSVHPRMQASAQISGEFKMVRSNKGFTLVEIMIVVAIIGILIAIAVPSFLRAREISRRNACQENQSKIDGAKQQWALEQNKPADAEPTWDELTGNSNYIRKSPVCPSSGSYVIGAINEDPSCSNSDQAAFPHTFPQSGT